MKLFRFYCFGEGVVFDSGAHPVVLRGHMPDSVLRSNLVVLRELYALKGLSLGLPHTKHAVGLLSSHPVVIMD